MNILPKIIKKCKSKEFLDITIIILIAFGSFGLGKLSEISKNSPRSIITKEEVPKKVNLSTANVVSSLPSSGMLVASKNGTKYHFPWCAGASQIAEKNKIWFNSTEEARKAGYTPANNCKGLE